MKSDQQFTVSALLGSIEPHAPLLKHPPDGQLLYKITSIENLLRSIMSNYLHFNRVDSYGDFPDADPHDGQQLPKDEPGNVQTKFGKNSNFSAANYYDQARARTYACCFSLENSDFIWNRYAKESPERKVCVVFNFGKLRGTLNQMLQRGNAVLEYKGMQCLQIFSVNYGIVEYVDWAAHRANEEYLPNPIIYTYLKDSSDFHEEKELRISLSAFGLGHFALHSGSRMEFPSSLQFGFDFRGAIENGTIQQILYGPDCDLGSLVLELQTLRIVPFQGYTTAAV